MLTHTPSIFYLDANLQKVLIQLLQVFGSRSFSTFFFRFLKCASHVSQGRKLWNKAVNSLVTTSQLLSITAPVPAQVSQPESGVLRRISSVLIKQGRLEPICSTFRIVKSFWRGHRIKRRWKGHSFRASVLSQGHGFLKQSLIKLDEKWYGVLGSMCQLHSMDCSYFNITWAHHRTCHVVLTLIG